MKKLFSTILVALVATVASYAQTIAVVSSNGSTTMYQDFGKAVNEAKDGSTIYLPGGGFQLNDTIRIKHKVTIMGVSHRADTDNAEGATTIAGNVWFNQGSDGSALMGVYVSGDVHVGEDVAVANILLRYCNVNSVQVHKSESSGMIVNQCYLRKCSNFGNCNVTLENNVLRSAKNINGGKIDHNIITSQDILVYWGRNDCYALLDVSNSIITNNFLIGVASDVDALHRGSDCIITNNCRGQKSWGEMCLQLEESKNWDDVFKKDPSEDVKVTSDYHLKGTIGKGKGTNGTDIGIYLNSDASTGFDDEALAPIPRIISKEIPEQTDASGKLNIKITVKAK